LSETAASTRVQRWGDEVPKEVWCTQATEHCTSELRQAAHEEILAEKTAAC